LKKQGLTVKDQDKNKDLRSVLKDSLRTRRRIWINITANLRNVTLNDASEPRKPLPPRLTCSEVMVKIMVKIDPPFRVAQVSYGDAPRWFENTSSIHLERRRCDGFND